MPISQSSSRVESLQSKTLVIDADSAKAPVITMLLESASKEDLEDLELLDEDIIDMNTDVIDSGSQVQIRILDLPADIVYNPLQSDPTDRWTIGDSLGLTSPEQERHPLYFDQIDETPGSIEKAYAKLYYRSSEIVYSIIDLAKWVYSKCYQYYWYTLINLSVRYPKFGTWLYNLVSAKRDHYVEFEELKEYLKTKAIGAQACLLKYLASFINTVQRYPLIGYFLVVYLITVSSPFIVLSIIMSLWSFVVFWFYLGSFFVVGTVAAAFVLPFMTASLFFATGVVICGFFSNLSFKSAQLLYDQFVGTLQATLKNMADQVPPVAGDDQGDAPQRQQGPEIQKLQNQKMLDSIFEEVLNTETVTNATREEVLEGVEGPQHTTNGCLIPDSVPKLKAQKETIHEENEPKEHTLEQNQKQEHAQKNEYKKEEEQSPDLNRTAELEELTGSLNHAPSITPSSLAPETIPIGA